jgi:hypothetical protein
MADGLVTGFSGAAIEIDKRRRPHGYADAPVDAEQARLLRKLALDVFTDMSNAGQPFVYALAAVYLTGMMDALSAQKDRT